MTWIAWRYQRSIAFVLALVVAVFIGFVVTIGVLQHHDMVLALHAHCIAVNLTCGRIYARLNGVANYDPVIRSLGFVLAPLIGALLGALALASELDSRTSRLAWTQSISRTRWFAAKVGVGAGVVTVLVTPLVVVLSWWSGTIGNGDQFGRASFAIGGWDLAAYAIFLFALTVLVGSALRRVGWALAAAIVLFAVIAYGFPSQVRSSLVTPTVAYSPPSIANLETFGSITNEWLLVSGVVSRSTTGIPSWSDVYSADGPYYRCDNSYPHDTQTQNLNAERVCEHKYNLVNVAVYIPERQYWTLQLREGLIYLFLGVALAGGALFVVRRIEP